MKKLIIPLFFVVNLTACLTVINVPTQVNSPTTLGDNVLDVSVFGARAPVNYVKDEGDEGIETRFLHDQPWLPALGLKLGYGVTNNIDVELQTEYAYIGLPYISLGMKYQWLGAPIYKTKRDDWNSTAQLKFMLGHIKTTRTSSSEEGALADKVRIWVSGFSLSNSFGYMIQDWLVVYGGGQAIYMFVDYKLKKQGNTKLSKVESHIWGYGPFAGVQLNTTLGSVWKVVFSLEGSFTNLPVAAGFYKGKERHWTPGVAGSLSVLFPF